MKIGQVLSMIGAVLFAGSVALPDTTVGSPRSVALAVAGVFIAVSAGLSHAQGTAPASQ